MHIENVTAQTRLKTKLQSKNRTVSIRAPNNISLNLAFSLFTLLALISLFLSKPKRINPQMIFHIGKNSIGEKPFSSMYVPPHIPLKAVAIVAKNDISHFSNGSLGLFQNAW